MTTPDTEISDTPMTETDFPQTHVITLPLSAEAFAALGAPHLVYIRSQTAGEAIPDQPDALIDMELAPDQTVYSVHRADGARLAVMTDRDAAYAAAIANTLAPVAVH